MKQVSKSNNVIFGKALGNGDDNTGTLGLCDELDVAVLGKDNRVGKVESCLDTFQGTWGITPRDGW